MRKHWQNTHSEDKGPPKFRFEVVKYCRTALERQVGEATRISLRKHCLNSKAGYNRSGLTRLTLKPEEAPPTKQGRGEQEKQEREGLEAMRWRCNKTAQEESKMCRKRKDGEGDQGMRKRKKVRKLRYNKVEADWGLEETGIQAMEDQEVARTRFLHSDRSRAKVGNIQTTIRIWTETEMFARIIIIDCLDNVQKEAEKNYLRETTRWLECEEAGEELTIL